MPPCHDAVCGAAYLWKRNIGLLFQTPKGFTYEKYRTGGQGQCNKSLTSDGLQKDPAGGAVVVWTTAGVGVVPFAQVAQVDH